MHNGNKESQANQRFYARSKHINVQMGFIKKGYKIMFVSCFRMLAVVLVSDYCFMQDLSHGIV